MSRPAAGEPRDLPQAPSAGTRIPCRFEFKTEGIPGEQLNWQHMPDDSER